MNSCYPSLSPKTFRSDSVTVDFLSYFSSIKSNLEPVKRKERKEARSRKKKRRKQA